jgi:gliding motility-associated-like protein
VLYGRILVGIGLDSTSGKPIQEVCRLAPIKTIIYNFAGGSAIAKFNPALPNGVDTLTGPAGQFKIFGTPTVSGTFDYTVTAKGSCDSASSLYGRMTIGIGSPTGATQQRKCINTVIDTITYIIPSLVTSGVTILGLPPGVTYTMTPTFTPTQVMIIGTPTVSGTFNYTLTTQGYGACVTVSFAYGTIIVDNDTIKLSSGNPYQKICIGNPIKPLSYIVSGTGTTGQANGDGLSQIYPSKIFTVNFTPPAAAGTYTYTVKTSGGCLQGVAASTFTIDVLDPQASFTFDPHAGTPPLNVNFTNTSTNASSYTWDFGDGNKSNVTNPSDTYSKEGEYTITLTAKIASSDSVCKTSATGTVIAFQLVKANVFTPNGDGVNDIFEIKSIGITSIDGEIYNRWGTKVYEWHKQDEGWNGKDQSTGADCPVGTYYYVVKITDVNGKQTVDQKYFLLTR